MLGMLSYTVNIAVYPVITESFAPQAIWNGVLLSLVLTWPIALVIGPMFYLYIANVRKGRKILRDTTVFFVSILCLIAEIAYVKLISADS